MIFFHSSIPEFGVKSADSLPMVNPDVIEEFKQEAEEEVTLKSND
mgnify:CR=1 FL=1